LLVAIATRCEEGFQEYLPGGENIRGDEEGTAELQLQASQATETSKTFSKKWFR
jgi:hypothetical protein